MVPAPSMPDLQTEAMDLAEKGAKLACGSRFKRLPRLILRKLSLPVVAVIGVIWFVYAEAMAVATRWMENSVPGVVNTGVLSFNAGVGFLMYLCCVYRDPGRVPTAWRPPALNDLETGDEIPELTRGRSDAVITADCRSSSARAARGTARSAQSTNPRGRITAGCATGAFCAWTTTACG